MARRFFRHGELPLVILALLEQRPMRGHEVMDDLRRLFAPGYHASAGAVYPALSTLRAQGAIQEVSVLGTRADRLTERGASLLAAGRHVLSGVEARTGQHLQDLGLFKLAVERFAGRVLATEGRVSPRAVADILERTASRIERLAAGPRSTAP